VRATLTCHPPPALPFRALGVPGRLLPVPVSLHLLKLCSHRFLSTFDASATVWNKS
jgi:hypothetical protein